MKEKTKAYSIEYTLLTYAETWDNMKAKFGLSDKELHERVQGALQMWAWSDIMESVKSELIHGNDPEVLRLKAIVDSNLNS